MKRILILMSDTGGGHRAAAEALRDALHAWYGNEVKVELVDVFRAYSPFPLKNFPELYPWIVNRSKSSWHLGYNFSNTRRRAKALSRGMYVTIEAGLKQMLHDHPADVIVSVHSLLSRPAMEALKKFRQRPPFIVVVTDLVSTHMFWYEREADRTLVPTEPAYERGLEAGIAPEKMRVTGLPVHPRFADSLTDKASARKQLGWDPDLPAVLMVGGGEGMGPLYLSAQAINDRELQCQLAIIAGNNKELKAQLDASEWNQLTHVYGFVRNMPVLMAASDILVTKAGPATISEACIAGLPMILNDAIPGQETGNLDYVVENGAGVFASHAGVVGEVVAAWLAQGEERLQRRAEKARKLGRPQAVWDIADEIWRYAQMPPIPNDRRGLLRVLTVGGRQQRAKQRSST